MVVGCVGDVVCGGLRGWRQELARLDGAPFEYLWRPSLASRPLRRVAESRVPRPFGKQAMWRPSAARGATTEGHEPGLIATLLVSEMGTFTESFPVHATGHFPCSPRTAAFCRVHCRSIQYPTRRVDASSSACHALIPDASFISLAHRH